MKERLGVRVPLLLALALLGALAFARTESAYAGTGPVLVVVAHPDNEALGMSGVIANSLAAGRRVYVAVVTNGDSKRSGTLSGYCGAAAGQGASTAAYGLQRDAESLDAMSLLGLHWSANPTTSDVFFLGYPNSGLTTIAGSSTAWTGDQTFLHTTYAEDGDGSNATCNGDLRYLLSGHHSTFTAGELATDLDSLFALTHAYAISVHKAQGAEFPAVVVPLVTSHAPMLGRTLLYTAMTRARRLLVIVGQKKALYLAVRDWRRAPRHTALGRLLDGTLRLDWRPRGGGPGQPIEEAEPSILDGLGDGPAEP